MSISAQASEVNWEERYAKSHAQAQYEVSKARVARWRGQEEDVVWDIVQESTRKTLEYMQKTENGGGQSVQSLPGFMSKTIKNHTIDLLRRRETQVFRESATVPLKAAEDEAPFDEVAIENVYQEGLFRLAARKIAQFPPKQRRALLTYLASDIAFDRKPTVLQAALRSEGIRLEEYQQLQPRSEQERKNNAALLHQAKKRLRNLEELQEYLA